MSEAATPKRTTVQRRTLIQGVCSYDKSYDDGVIYFRADNPLLAETGAVIWFEGDELVVEHPGVALLGIAGRGSKYAKVTRGSRSRSVGRRAMTMVGLLLGDIAGHLAMQPSGLRFACRNRKLEPWPAMSTSLSFPGNLSPRRMNTSPNG